ncbi:MAG: metal-dependent hydrolase [Candidatus Korarchaeota archaeon]|nr:metal-dependent hydrolase [Candidatus Korarchaeota archaeon]NIU85547.1 hypothetical protein [Candidatus Thorarchaeota archaeon]NIW15658.1 hypothetical protein [Candidatus Thorarchaeota archaeon]NIW53588.1 hypothetical protein [Candidatus Korarchaeota archaeon]
MPLTPLHLGPGMALGMLFKRWINLPAILLASVIVDVRAIYLALIVGNWSNLHGFFHTFIGATLLGLVVIGLVWLFHRPLSQISRMFHIKQEYSLQPIITGSLLGVWLHVVLDSYMHRDMDPFWPFISGNSLYGGIFAGFELLFICMLGFLMGGGIYLYSVLKTRKAKTLIDRRE